MPASAPACANAVGEHHRCRRHGTVLVRQDRGASAAGGHRPGLDLCDQRKARRPGLVVTTVRGLDPFGLIHHPELTVIVADVDRLVNLSDRTAPTAAGGD